VLKQIQRGNAGGRMSCADSPSEQALYRWKKL
jgi:hypothetical protein